jgi:hypothetical protein
VPTRASSEQGLRLLGGALHAAESGVPARSQPDDHGNGRYRNTVGEKPYSIAVAGVIEKECRSDAVASLRIAIWRDGAARCSVPKNERAPAIAGAFR